MTPDINTTTNWSNNDLVGPCGETTGGYVVAVQSFLYARGVYSGNIDNIDGSVTTTAVKRFQGNNGLTQDGCVGPLTWAKMQSKLLNENDNAVAGLNGRPTVPFPYGSPSGSSCRWYTDTAESGLPTVSPVTKSNWEFDSGLLYSTSVLFCGA
ncbi:MAG: peptidoglycan-binding protein [Frankiaceae bacterium]